MAKPIQDLDPPVAPLINTAGAIDVAAGALLLVFSELIHNVIGVVLILFGLYLFYRARQIPDAVARTLKKAAEERGSGADSGGDDPHESAS
jgi:uncharacterized membrane protein YfcA